MEPDVAHRWSAAQAALQALQSPLPTTHTSTTFRPSASRSLDAPARNRVEVSRSPQELLLKMPGGNDWPPLAWFTLILVGLMIGRYVIVGVLQLLGTASLLFPLMVPLLIVGAVIYWESRPIFVQFDSDRFVIYKKLGKTAINLTQGSTAQIANVFHTLKTVGHGRNTYERRVIVLQSGFSEDSFGINLTWEECAWLVDVIQDWLSQR